MQCPAPLNNLLKKMVSEGRKKKRKQERKEEKFKLNHEFSLHLPNHERWIKSKMGPNHEEFWTRAPAMAIVSKK